METSTMQPPAFPGAQPPQPPGTLSDTSVLEQQPPVDGNVSYVEIDEPETDYAKKQKAIFEAIVGLEEDGDLRDPLYAYCWCPKAERDSLRRLAKKGWRPDPHQNEELGKEDYILLRMPKMLHSKLYRAAAKASLEAAGEKVSETPFNSPDAAPDVSKAAVMAKSAKEILDNLPETDEEIDES